MSKIVENILSSVGSTMKAPVCKTEVELDLRSQLIRTAEVCKHKHKGNPTKTLIQSIISVLPLIGLQTSLDTHTTMPSVFRDAGAPMGSSYVRAPYVVIRRTDLV